MTKPDLGHVILIAAWFVCLGTMAVLGLAFPRSLQSWSVSMLKRMRVSSFLVSLAGSRYSLWQTRIVGIFTLALLLFVAYRLLIE